MSSGEGGTGDRSMFLGRSGCGRESTVRKGGRYPNNANKAKRTQEIPSGQEAFVPMLLLLS